MAVQTRFVGRNHWTIMTWLPLVFLSGLFSISPLPAAESGLRLATFSVDATPPLGSPVAYAPARSVDDPLKARGIVLLGAGQPVVLCAVDWIGIGNDGHTIWREKLAEAAGTTADHVAVHSLHQHDTPRCDFRAEELMKEQGFGGARYDTAFCRQTIENVATAIREAIPRAQSITHLGIGHAKVDRVASNRRILGDDGKVKIVRYSSCRNPEGIAAPEGLIDPELKLISFWNEDVPIASLTYYATHPQSYYGKGDVTSEFVGLARARRDAALPNVMHVHFNGAGGNVAAGKYNDGAPERRVELTDRMEDGMKRAWASMRKVPIRAADVEWRVVSVRLPVAEHLTIEGLRQRLKETPVNSTKTFAPILAFVERDDGSGVLEDLSCLRLGSVSLVHMPGELFVEYQLAAQKMRPDQTVCMAAYGDYAPGYIGTEIAYSQGGYETSRDASHVSPAVEQVLLAGLRDLLHK
jgi:hypothetical protein